MTKNEAMQMALAALIEVNTDSFHGGWVGYVSKEIEALRAALAQPEPEPVAWLCERTATGDKFALTNDQLYDIGYGNYTVRPFKKIAPLYTASPQREWIWLADWEESQLMADYGNPPYELIRDIQLKLKEKNYDK